jgi:general secretion pathway protein G
LIELVLVLGIIGTLAGLAVPAAHDSIDRARVARATGDINAMEADLAGFQAHGDSLPTSLAGVGRAGFLDPWGRPYQYLRIAGSGKKAPAGARKDRFLVPINSDYDLYSMGKDGKSTAPLTASDSRDDVVRANDGGYIGLAAHY